MSSLIILNHHCNRYQHHHQLFSFKWWPDQKYPSDQVCYYNLGAMLALVDPGPDNKKADGVVDEVLRFSG